jgi:hypothetical protein
VLFGTNLRATQICQSNGSSRSHFIFTRFATDSLGPRRGGLPAAAMLSQINEYAPRMHLPIAVPILKLWEGEDTFRKHKHPLIYDVPKLVAVTDDDFLKYTAQQRKDIVEKFAGIKANKDFLTNIPTPFFGKFSAPKPSRVTNLPAKP